MYRLITICCYFGKLPEHFPLFLLSIEKNPTIDFLLITDCEVEAPPANLRVYNCSFEDVRARIQSVVGFPISLDRPYKLCDFRPVWPLAFHDLIDGHDFWGHCDMDMIFGDIRKFLPDEVLEKHDKIYRFGHLSYYRNTDEVTQRYRLDGGYSYKEVFSSPDGFAFDEIAGMGNIYEKHDFPAYYSVDCADITYGKVRFTLSYFHVPAELVAEHNYDKQIFYWENGHVYRARLKDGQILRDEFNYIHFSKRDMPCNGVTPATRSFFITNRGLFPKSGDVLLSDIDKYNPHEPLPEFLRSIECKYRHLMELKHYYWGILKKKIRR